jgi:O-succinylbenzoic acid--CoA ligase
VLPLWDLVLDVEDTLTVRGSALAKGYALKQNGTWQWQPLDAAAGLRTRDRAQIWLHGSRRFLRFVGREASFVKVLGELVNVAALQSRLENLALELGLPSNQVVIWPMPDDRRETKLILIGEMSEFSIESLRLAFNEKSLGPERLHESRVVEKIPRTALGKLDRGSMTKLVEEFR